MTIQPRTTIVMAHTRDRHIIPIPKVVLLQNILSKPRAHWVSIRCDFSSPMQGLFVRDCRTATYRTAAETRAGQPNNGGYRNGRCAVSRSPEIVTKLITAAAMT